MVLYSQYVRACCSKTIVYPSANACPPTLMQRLVREMRRLVLGTLEHTFYPTGHQKADRIAYSVFKL